MLWIEALAFLCPLALTRVGDGYLKSSVLHLRPPGITVSIELDFVVPALGIHYILDSLLVALNVYAVTPPEVMEGTLVVGSE